MSFMQWQSRSPAYRRIAPASGLALAVALALNAGAASAGEFTFGEDGEGRWSFNMSLGTNVRATDADPDLVSVGNGGRSGIQNDNGSLNFDKGDAFSTILRAVGDVELRKGNFGAFFRAKAWYDYTLENEKVAHGSYANGYVPNQKLDDSDFETLSKFSGVALLDAFVFADFTAGDDIAGTIKLGSHVVNWGESLFTPGINQYGAFDLSAARRPGSQVKETLLPIPQVSFSVGFGSNLSVEGFYQLKWEKTILDGCGTYWSPASLLNCSDQGTIVGSGFSDYDLYNGVAALGGLNFRMDMYDVEAQDKDDGQFGFAARYFFQEIGTEVGLYRVQYNPRTPILSPRTDATTIPGSVWGMTLPGRTKPVLITQDYTATGIDVTGLSVSSNVAGWSVLGEVSYTEDFPVQINATDMLNGTTAGVGPMRHYSLVPPGEYLQGYHRKEKIQAQLATVKLFPRVLGAESLSLIGEVAFQHWESIGDPSTGAIRYGRAFVNGTGPYHDIGGTCPGQSNPIYCEDEGYVTPDVWGYKLLAQLTYPGAFAGFTVKPRLYWAHDVKGYAGDGLFIEDRQTLSIGSRFEYGSRYYIDAAYTRYNSDARYDVFRDRDFFSISFGLDL